MKATATETTSEVSGGGESKMGFPLPHSTSFCCCISLEIGAYVIGGLHFVTAIFLVGISSFFASQFATQMGTVEDEGDHLYSTLYKLAVSVAVLSVVHIFLACTLLIGTCTRKTCLLRAWVVIMCLLSVCAVVACVVITALTGVNGTGSHIFLSFLEGVLFFGFVSYCIVCVHSYYLMLKSFEDMQGPASTPY